MTRNLKALSLALVAAFAMSAVAASTAVAVNHESFPASFTTTAGAGVTAIMLGEQIGIDTLTITGKPPITCATVTLNGKAVTAGPSSEKITISPVFATCHIVLFGITKPVTITVNECTYQYTATTTTTTNAERHVTAHTNLVCPGPKQIEIHIYNNAAHTEVLCTSDIPAQTNLTEITLTNKVNTPGPVNDIEGHFNVTMVQHNTILSPLCGETTNTSLVHAGTHTMRATVGGVLSDLSISG